jgi:hypothetical protein
VVSISAGGALAQNTDTVILENGRRFSIINQITDTVERDALLKIYRARTPRASGLSSGLPEEIPAIRAVTRGLRNRGQGSY